MKYQHAVLLIAIILFASAHAFSQTDDTAKFSYNSKRAIPVGTVLHYVKT